MMGKNLFAAVLLLMCTQTAVSMSSDYYQPSIWQTMQNSTACKTGVCLTAAVVIGIGIYKCWSWLSNKWRLETDRSLVAQAQQRCQEVNNKFNSILNLIEPKIANPEQVDDYFMAQISHIICPADKIGCCHETIASYNDQLKIKIQELGKKRDSLAARVARSKIQADIEQATNQLSVNRERLTQLSQLIERNHHHIVMQALWYRHETEIAGIQQTADRQEQWRVIKSAVMNYQFRHKKDRAYLTFVGDLSNSLQTIYPFRGFLSQAANPAYQALENIKNAILISEEYRTDQVALQQALARQRELEVQRAKAAAAAEQAKAQQMQAAAQQQRARADIEKAYERRRERQRNTRFNVLDFIHDVIHPIY